jgi:hypothetical protein
MKQQFKDLFLLNRNQEGKEFCQWSENNFSMLFDPVTHKFDFV